MKIEAVNPVTDKTIPTGKAITRNAYPKVKCDYCQDVIPPNMAIFKFYAKCKDGLNDGWCYDILRLCMTCAVEDDELKQAVDVCRVQSTFCNSCARPLALLRWYKKIQPYCSPLCYQRAKKGVKQAAEVCGCCGDAYMPKRSDSKYCSGKCRQKAYRYRAVEA